MAVIDRVLERQISYQGNAWGLPSAQHSVSEILNDIKGEKYAGVVGRLREFLKNGHPDKYAIEKKRLPGVTFSGTFDGSRQLPQLSTYSGILVIDIDDLSEGDLAAATASLKEDAHVLACWISPSGAGLKALVELDFSRVASEIAVPDRHRLAFAHVSTYFSNSYRLSLDRSGSDVTRLCFLSHDPQLTIRYDALPFQIDELHVQESLRIGQAKTSAAVQSSIVPRGSSASRLQRTEGKNSPADRSKMASIIKFLTKKPASITRTYEQWVRVAFAIANTFTYDIGKGYYLKLCQLDGVAHDEDGSIRLLESVYHSTRGSISFATIIHFARQEGYKS